MNWRMKKMTKKDREKELSQEQIDKICEILDRIEKVIDKLEEKAKTMK